MSAIGIWGCFLHFRWDGKIVSLCTFALFSLLSLSVRTTVHFWRGFLGGEVAVGVLRRSLIRIFSIST